MAPWDSSDRVFWNGRLTVDQVADNLARKRRTVLRLPMRYHPAFSASLYDLPTRKRIDIAGDATLLQRLGKIDGLSDLLKLIPAMERVGSRLRIRSPAPHLVFNVPPTARGPRVRPARELQHGEPWVASRTVARCHRCGAIHRAETPSSQY